METEIANDKIFQIRKFADEPNILPEVIDSQTSRTAHKQRSSSWILNYIISIRYSLWKPDLTGISQRDNWSAIWQQVKIQTTSQKKTKVAQQASFKVMCSK